MSRAFGLADTPQAGCDFPGLLADGRLRRHMRVGVKALATKRILRVFLAVAAACLLSGCPSPRDREPIRVVVTDGVETAPREPDAQDVIELAKREGELVWYTSLPEAAARAFLKLYSDTYPFIATRLVRESTFDIIRRLEGEVESGRVEADVLHVLDVAIFAKWRKEGQLLRYFAPEERFIPAQYKDSGYWSALRCVGLCIAYDPKRLSPQQVPQTWPDLLDPRWKGRIALKDAQTAGSAYAHYYFLREEYGVSYWQRMARQRPRVYKTAEESLSALESGEVDLVAGAMDYSVSEAQEAGKSVAAIWPRDGVPMMLGPVAIMRAAPHPNAARLFVNLALSRRGQQALRDLLGAYSVRPDVAPPPGRPPLSELSVLTPTGGWDEYAQKQDRLQAEYTSLFHPGSE